MKLLIAGLIFCSLPMLAAEPFTGTWKEDIATRKVSGALLTLELSNGVYKVLSANPYTVKADGTDQAVSGSTMISVNIIDDHSVEVTQKTAGKIVNRTKRTVSSDGTTFTAEIISYPAAGGAPVTTTNIRQRVGAPVPGMHLLSGSWAPPKKQSESDNGLLVTFEQTADGLKVSTPTGINYDAKFDGKEYPVSGTGGTDSKVVLKRIGATSIEETNKSGDKVLGTSLYTLSADGQSVTEEDHLATGRTVTYLLRKQ